MANNQQTPHPSPLLEMRGITKRFGQVLANNQVSFSVNPGEVHALLGENGAGKSTLMKILYGLYQQDEGTICYKNQEIRINSSRKAIDLGIGMVHQHFMLIPAHSVIENVVLGHAQNNQVLDLKSSAKRLLEMAERYHMEIDPWKKVSELSVGQQQRLEILKALFRDAELLILDEPTAVLTPQEVSGLFEVIRQLTREGKTVIFISHKLHEVMTICDRCTVLRQGEVVAAGRAVSEIQNYDELATLMVGKKIKLTMEKTACKLGPSALSVQNLCYTDPSTGLNILKDISFELKSGEILGVCGVDGNGQSELIKCITGLLRPTSGTIRIAGEETTYSETREILARGVSHIPEDRHKMGMVGAMNIRENLAMVEYASKEYNRFGFMNWKKIDQVSRELVERFNVKTPDMMEPAGNLSGGNQQKMVVAREFSRKHKLLIAVHPSRGLDIGATKYIQQEILAERDNCTAVLLVSTELDEIMEISDRIMVMYEGRIMAILPQSAAERQQLGLLMAGVKPEDKKKQQES